MATIKEFVDEIIADGIITSEEHEQFMKLVHEDGEIDEEESAQISRIFRLVSEGKVKIVAQEREANIDRQALEEAKQAAIEEDMRSQEIEQLNKQTSAEGAEDKDAFARREAISQAMKKVALEKDASRNRVAEFFEERKRQRK